jgi:hypothetical protein
MLTIVAPHVHLVCCEHGTPKVKLRGVLLYVLFLFAQIQCDTLGFGLIEKVLNEPDYLEVCFSNLLLCHVTTNMIHQKPIHTHTIGGFWFERVARTNKRSRLESWRRR